MFCEESLGKITFRAFPKRVGPRCLSLEILKPATGDVFPVVANTRTKSIQKQVKSIDVDKVGSKKPLASNSCFV